LSDNETLQKWYLIVLNSEILENDLLIPNL
jgi:hypothetical protein